VLTTLLDILGLALLIAFAYSVEPVAALAAGGVACLLLSYRITHGTQRR
jgi:hypothetical protein